MKIAVDCRMCGMSGIGVFLENILDSFIINHSNNSYLLIGDASKLESYKKYPYCKIIQSDIPIFSLKELLCFPIKEINKCDVFYSPNFNLPFGIKIPIFSTIHDVVFLDVDGLTSELGKCIRWIAIWRAVRSSKAIFTVSNFSKQRISYHFKKVPDIIVTNCGINRELKSFSVNNESPYPYQYILFIGNIKKHKGLDILLETYERVSQFGFKPKLVIVGDYMNLKTADNDILNRSLDQNEYVVFTGKISNDQLYNMIAHADCLIQPSSYEGFGIPPLEALYLGCNAIVSDIPVFQEIYGSLPVTFFDRGNLNDLADKILNSKNQYFDKNSIKSQIDSKYSFNRSAQLIMKRLERGC